MERVTLNESAVEPLLNPKSLLFVLRRRIEGPSQLLEPDEDDAELRSLPVLTPSIETVSYTHLRAHET